MAFLISLVIVLIVAGALMWLVEIAPFLDGQIKGFIRWIIIVFVVLYLLGILAGYTPLVTLPMRR